MENLHEKFMSRCLDLASLGAPYAPPNPMVGCVIVHDGKIVGEGYHREYGGPHAEVNAVNSVIDPSVLPESTLYVSLEPCCHFGKTPPCTSLILEKGIKKVVVGMQDPFARVSGEGIRILREAGIEVTVGILEDRCLYLNRRFITYHTRERPWVTLKWAQTTDGFLDACRPPEIPPVWMTGPICKRLVHRLRAEHRAILVGTRTLVMDNPSLTVRAAAGPQPLRIAMDRNLRTSPGLKVYDGTTPTLLLTLPENLREAERRYPGVDIAALPHFGGEEGIAELLRLLYSRNVQSLLIEGGTGLLQSFIGAGLWDETVVFIAPKRLAELYGKSPVLSGGIGAPAIPGRTVDTKEIS